MWPVPPNMLHFCSKSVQEEEESGLLTFLSLSENEFLGHNGAEARSCHNRRVAQSPGANHRLAAIHAVLGGLHRQRRHGCSNAI